MSRRCKATSGRSKAAARPTRTGPTSEHTGRGRTNRALNGRAAETVLGAERGRTNRARNGRVAKTVLETKERPQKSRAEQTGRRDRTRSRKRPCAPHWKGLRGGVKESGTARKSPAGGAPREVRSGRCAAGGAQHRKIRAGVYRTIHPGPNCRKGTPEKKSRTTAARRIPPPA